MNIVEALEANGIEFKKGSKEDEYRICCPFCEDEGYSLDTRYRFGFNITTGQGHCFNCGKAFSDTALHAVIRKLKLGEIVEIQKKIKAKKAKESALEVIKLPVEFQKLPEQEWSYWGRRAWRYARDRGLTRGQVIEKEIGYAESGEFAFRLIIPVKYKRKLYGLVGRDFTNTSELKYKNSTGGKALFNVPENKASTAVLSEGAFDALAIERAIHHRKMDSLAVLGSSLSEEQLRMLRGYDRIILWSDPDKAGVRNFLRIGEQVYKEITEQVLMVTPEDGEPDPDEMGSAKILKKIQAAKVFTPEISLKMEAWVAFNE